MLLWQESAVVVIIGGKQSCYVRHRAETIEVWENFVLFCGCLFQAKDNATQGVLKLFKLDNVSVCKRVITVASCPLHVGKVSTFSQNAAMTKFIMLRL